MWILKYEVESFLVPFVPRGALDANRPPVHMIGCAGFSLVSRWRFAAMWFWDSLASAFPVEMSTSWLFSVGARRRMWSLPQTSFQWWWCQLGASWCPTMHFFFGDVVEVWDSEDMVKTMLFEMLKTSTSCMYKLPSGWRSCSRAAARDFLI